MKLNILVILSIIALFVMPISAVSLADIRAEGLQTNTTNYITIVGQMNQTMNQTPNMTAGPQGQTGSSGINGSAGTTDHHLLSNLTTGDDHTQYALLAGRAGGQTLKGGTTTGNLTLNGSQSGGNVILNPKGGNVGIGTTTPATKLQITGSTEPFEPIRLSSLSNAGGETTPIKLSFYFGSGAVTPYESASIYSAQTNGYGSSLTFATNDDPEGSALARVYISSGGNVGIGTVSPSTQLHTTGGVRFANFGAGAATFDANGVISSLSDEKAKTNINSFSKGLNELLQINPIIYKYSENSGLDTKNEYVGFSAQNLQKAVPEIVYSKPDIKYEPSKTIYNTTDMIATPTGTNTLSIYDRGLMALMVNSIKEQQTQIEKQQKQIDDLTNRITKLEEKI